MSLINPNKTFCYRIMHIDNLEHILVNGLCASTHENADSDYISIGNPEIISTRDKKQVRLTGYGSINEYVPFYFTPRSIMLFNIITGYQAPIVPQRNRQEILIIRCKITDLAQPGQWFFTDGQANAAITQYYNDLNDLDAIDWNAIQNSNFSKQHDEDRARRYQAELLVYHHVPLSMIESFHVYNDSARKFVIGKMQQWNIENIPAQVSENYYF